MSPEVGEGLRVFLFLLRSASADMQDIKNRSARTLAYCLSTEGGREVVVVGAVSPRQFPLASHVVRTVDHTHVLSCVFVCIALFCLGVLAYHGGFELARRVVVGMHCNCSMQGPT